MIDAVVLAGRSNNGPLSSCSQAKNEALIEINNRHMVEYVLRALSESSRVNNIYVVGLEGIKDTDLREDKIYYLPNESSVIKNVLVGISKCKTDKVLITASDIPLLSPSAIEEFIASCNNIEEADFYYPIVAKEIIESKFSEMQRTYVKTREGIFTGGNIFLVKAGAIPPIAGMIQEFIDNRKSPFRLCSLLGVKLILLFLLHRLTISVVERKVSKISGIKAKAVLVNSPEIGIDVDKPSDLEIVTECITKLC